MKEDQNFEELWKNAKLTKDEVIEQFKKSYPTDIEFETKFFMMNQEDIKPLTIGTRVKHTVRNFTGVVSKYDFGDTCIVTPDNPEIKELYPFGIESKISELTIIIPDKPQS